MTTLYVADIFKNFAFYQAQYTSILNNPKQYQIPVLDAILDVWPSAAKQLYLGDVLQLWFSQKWLINTECRLISKEESIFLNIFNTKIQKDDLYLCELHGNAFLGKSIAKVWSMSEQKLLAIELEGSLQYYCTYKMIHY